GEDLRRFQAGKAIRARPVGRAERAWKWVRRNRAGAMLLAGVVLSLMLGTVVASVFAVMANARARLARRHLYLAQMKLAEEAWNKGHIRRLLELLQETQDVPSGEEDLRGFEWQFLWRCAHTDLMTLQGHARYGVKSVCFSPDGKRLASADDWTVNVWDA